MVVVITGASSGIGLALARELSARGSRLVLASRRLEKLQEINHQLGGEHLVLQTDVSVPAECQRLIHQTYARFGRLDTLVCNAGYGASIEIADMDPDAWSRMLATNLLGTTECIRAAVPMMMHQPIAAGYRAQIMIVTSAAARRGLPFFGAYAATKAAQLSVAEALRAELYDDQIAVTSVHPVTTETAFFDRAEAEGKTSVNTPGRQKLRRSAESVAIAMARGIIRPKREVWPMRPSRLLLSLATAWPWLADRIMIRMTRQIRTMNESRG